MPSPRLPLALAVTASVLTGFALGWFCRPGPSTPPPISAAAATSASRSTHPLADDSSGPAPAFDAASAEPAADAYRQRLRLAQAAAGLDRAGIVAALEHEHTLDLPDGNRRTLATEALLARFAELDPADAALWLVQTYPTEKIEGEWLNVTLNAWMSADANAALAWGRGLPAGPLRNRVYAELLDTLSATDPAGAARRIIAEGNGSTLDLDTIFAKLAEADLHAACEQASRLSPDHAAGAVNGIIDTWARTQPDKAYAWVAQIPPGSLRDAAIQHLYSVWGQHDPAAAAAWLTTRAGLELSRYAGEVAGDWAKSDLAAARAWSETLPPQVRQGVILTVVAAWAEADPRAATEYTAALPETERENALPSALSNWAKADLGAALAWTEQQTSPKVHAAALPTVCGMWSMTDPRACVDYLTKAPATDTTAREQLTQALSTWAANSPDAVWQWGQASPDPKQRGEAMSVALEVLAGSDPAGAAARLGQLPPDVQSEAAQQLAERWTQVDPAAAARWAGALPAGETRMSAAGSVVSAWTQYDAPAAAAWVGGQPAGEVRDAGIDALVGAHPAGLDPAAIVHLVQFVQSPERREQMLAQTIGVWMNEDKAGAQAWLEHTQEITPEDRKQLLESLTNTVPTPGTPID